MIPFVFTSYADALVYQYLRRHHRAEVDEIEIGAKGDKLFEPDENMLKEIAELMEDEVKELFIQQCPLAEPSNFMPGEQIFEELLSFAINQLDFCSIAEAFLKNVEFPQLESLPQPE